MKTTAFYKTHADHAPSFAEIQSHGVVLVLSDPEMVIFQASENFNQFFEVPIQSLIHQPIETWLGKEQTQKLKEIITEGELQPIKSIVLPLSTPLGIQPFDAVIYKTGSYLILEVEPVPACNNQRDLQSFYSRLRQFSVNLGNAGSEEVLFQTLVNKMRNLTGFDRVLLYKFEIDGRKTVVSESKKADIPSYLGLQFPPTEFSQSERSILSKKYLHLIPNVKAKPSKLMLDLFKNGEGLDFSLSVLYSPFLEQLENLKHLNIQASLTLSIFQNNKLWGFVECHHRQIRPIAYRIRMSLELIGQIFSSYFYSMQLAQQKEKEQQYKLLLAELTTALKSAQSFESVFQNQGELLCKILEADGAALMAEDTLLTVGSTPSAPDLKNLCNWVATHAPETLFSTNTIKKDLKEILISEDLISSFLTLPILNKRIFWFRKGKIPCIPFEKKAEKPFKESMVKPSSFVPSNEASLWTENNLLFAQKTAQLLEEKISRDQQIEREKKLNSIIKKNEARLQAVFNAVAEGILTFDKEGCIESFNPAVTHILGFRSEELAHQNIKNIIPELQIAKYNTQKKDGWTSHLFQELHALNSEGKKIPVLITIEEMELEDKPMFVCTLQDSRERIALKESRFLMEEFVNTSYDGYWDWHIQDDYEYMSPRFWEIFGFKPEEKEHHPSAWQSLIFEEDLPPTLENFKKHVETKGKHPYFQEVRYRHKDGSTVTVICRGKVIEWDKEGNPLRMIGTHTDVTHLKNIQKSLKEINVRFDSAMHGSCVGIWDWNLETNEIYWSPRLKEMLGITDPNFVPKFGITKSRIHPKDYERMLKALNDHLEHKTPYDLEFRMLHNKGHSIWIRTRGKAIWNEVGVPIRFTGSIDDITDQKIAEEKLKEAKDFQELVLASSPDMICVKDKNFKIIQANPAFQTLFPDEQANSKDNLGHDEKAFKNGSSETLETIFCPVKGKRTVFTKKVRFKNSKNDPFILSIGRDVTEREYLIKQLKNSNEELERFSCIASHDLKAPIRGIHNHAQLIKRSFHKTLGDEGNRRLARILELTRYMENLVSDLLYYSRLGRTELAIQETAIGDLINEVKKSLPQLEEENIQLEVEKNLPTILCDRLRIGELFHNLIHNAIQYNESSIKKIKIGAIEPSESEPNPIFYVKDNGIGIPEEYHKDIFQVFKGLHKRDAYGSGTGVGLSIVLKIIERHQGKIWLKSSKGKGSTFFFTLPGNP